MEKNRRIAPKLAYHQMQHTWKARRALAKKNATDAIAKEFGCSVEELFPIEKGGQQ